MIDAAAATQNWVNGMRNSVEKARKKVQSMTEAPGAKAAANAGYWQRQVSSPEVLERYRTNVAAVGMEGWRQPYLTKGLQRMGQGAADAAPKMQKHLAAFLPHVEAVAQQVRLMPKGGLQASIARMIAQVTGNANFRGTS